MQDRELPAGRLQSDQAMSRKSNINPDHYKKAGRGRQGQGIVQDVERQKFREEEASRSRGKRKPGRARKKPTK
jgi:hypothetical protein